MEHLETLSGLTYRTEDLPDSGFDIGSYRRAANSLSSDYVIFLNSYCRFLADDWLAKLFQPFRDATVGLAGATGSWESIYLNWTRALWFRGWPHLRNKIKMGTWYPGYPNPHVRSNAFLIGRLMFLELRIPEITAKEHAWRIESGRNSITRQVAARGLRTVIVGADGTVYDPRQWASAKIFRSGNQENLLIADNQTEEYAGGDARLRRQLAQYSWSGAKQPN
jgi:hypothetical protein